MADSSNGKPILEVEAILEQLGGDLDLLAEVAQIALDGTPDMISEVRQAVTEQNAVAVESAAHRIKGSLITIAAHAAADAALELERMGREGNLDRAGTAFVELEREVQRLLPELEKLTASGESPELS